MAEGPPAADDSETSAPPASGRPLAQLPELPCPQSHIRLLELLPTDAAATIEEQRASPIVCKVTVAPLGSSSPAFKALSYRWGAGGRDHSIHIGDASLPITESLDEVLRCLRRDDKSIVLWVDQICINQEDNKEKSHQVGKMDRIYTIAEQVIVWLGAAEDDSDKVMDLWATVGQDARDWGLEGYHTKERYESLQAMVAGQDPDSEASRSFHELLKRTWPITRPLAPTMAKWLQRPWFRRIWIVQEFALNANAVFMCGTKKVVAELVMLAMLVCRWSISVAEDRTLEELKNFLPEDPTSALFSIRQRRRKFANGTGTGDTLFQLLRRLYVGHSMASTDPRDRIYAILGLAIDKNDLGIRPNYEDANFKQLLVTTARALIERSSRVEVLCFSQYPRILDDLPTWVPEWTRTNQSFYSINDAVEEHLFAACGETVATVVPTEDERVLGLRGYRVDVIEETGSAWWDEGWNHARFASCLAQVKLLCVFSRLKDQPIYDSPSRRAEAVWRVPIGDTYYANLGVNGRRAGPEVAQLHQDCLEVCELYEQWKVLSLGEFDATKQRTRAVAESSASYRHSMVTMHAKRPYVTEKGYVGMAPPVAKPGDVVVVFCGGRVPFALRPAAEGRYTFVGEAYCDGIMDGEIVSRASEETFTIV